MDEVEKGRTFHFLSRSETDGGSEGNFCGEEKNSIVGARRQAGHARGGGRRGGGGDFRPSDGQIQNEEEEEEERRDRRDETRRTVRPARPPQRDSRSVRQVN